MKISDEGFDLIKHFEGCELEAYKCAAGVWTIGYGHTKDVQEGDVWNKEKAEVYVNGVSLTDEYEFICRMICCNYSNYTNVSLMLWFLGLYNLGPS
jgi:GH24 family phage-related lysozyme (muramidase)